MFVLIKDNIVHGAIDTTTQHANEIIAAGEYNCVSVGSDIPENGSTYDKTTGKFTTPIVPEPVPIPIVKRIAVGSFFDRFGKFKYPILASTNVGVQALIKDCSVRKFIDLDNPELPSGLDMIIAAGFAIDKNLILTTSVTMSEMP